MEFNSLLEVTGSLQDKIEQCLVKIQDLYVDELHENHMISTRSELDGQWILGRTVSALVSLFYIGISYQGRLPYSAVGMKLAAWGLGGGLHVGTSSALDREALTKFFKFAQSTWVVTLA
jgi:hypothetical protein